MKPKISVIIPIGGGRKMEALKTLQKQKIPVEIIIEEGENPSKNRNNGIKKAKGDIIAFINAHSILPIDWAEKIVNFFAAHPSIDIIGGPQLTPPKESYIGKISGYALTSVFGAAEASTRYKQTTINFKANEKLITSANLACRRSVVKTVQFDESLWPGEDPKFVSDAQKAKFKIAYTPDIFIHHRRRATIAEFAKQIFNYGYTRPKKESLLETIKNPSFLIPALFVVYLGIFAILAFLGSIFLIPLLLYAFLLIIFSFYEGIKNSDLGAIAILPFIFFVIHICYGLGFIAGTIKKIAG